MEKKKQIEQVQGDIKVIIQDTIYSISNDDDRKYLAEILYDAGYRKASDLAREIFEEIEDVINNIGYFDELDFEALKKKYIGEDTNVTTNTEEGK